MKRTRDLILSAGLAIGLATGFGACGQRGAHAGSTEGNDGTATKTHDITVLAETDRYITYYYNTYMYGGGAHGYTTEVVSPSAKAMVGRYPCSPIRSRPNSPPSSRKASETSFPTARRSR